MFPLASWVWSGRGGAADDRLLYWVAIGGWGETHFVVVCCICICGGRGGRGGRGGSGACELHLLPLAAIAMISLMENLSIRKFPEVSDALALVGVLDGVPEIKASL